MSDLEIERRLQLLEEFMRRRETDSKATAFGTYTPTLTNTTNIDASTAELCQYLRVGSVVTVSGRCQVDATAAASTVLGISLPIASNIGAVNDIGGVIVRGAGGVGEIRGNTGNGTAEAMWVAATTANTAYYIHFTYRII